MSEVVISDIYLTVAGEQDFPAILAMRKVCLSYLKNFDAVIEDGDHEKDKSYLCVAKVDGKVVGSGRADLIKPYTYKLTRIVTSEDSRLSGVGSQIMKHLEDYVKARKGLKVSLKTRLQTENFYKKLGYTKVGQYKNKHGTNYVYLAKKII